MIKMKDIAWLGGLLEGEGSFMLPRGKYPLIRLNMTDGDTVERAAIIMKSRVTRCKNQWVVQLNGVVAIQWMMTLYPFLNKNRRNRISTIVRYWRSHNFGQAANRCRSMAACHPDKFLEGFGLCRSCYMRWRKHRDRLTIEQWRTKFEIPSELTQI